MSKILFLAQFAPTEGAVLVPPKTPEEEFYAFTYHQKIIEVLMKQNYDFDTASDVNYLIRNHNKYQLVWSVYNRLGIPSAAVCNFFEQNCSCAVDAPCKWQII